MSILLGSVDDPVKITETCSPVSIEDNSISACICTTDFCNGDIELGFADNISANESDALNEKVIDEIQITVMV